MLVKDESGRGFGLGWTILVVGILIGHFARPLQWLQGASQTEEVPTDREVTLAPHLVPDPDPREQQDNGLLTLSFEIPEESAATLQRVRDRAVERGIIVQTEEDTVPATITADGVPMKADIRIKGDWTCLLYTSPSPRDLSTSRMPSSA